jgi:hypothetical protein
MDFSEFFKVSEIDNILNGESVLDLTDIEKEHI